MFRVWASTTEAKPCAFVKGKLRSEKKDPGNKIKTPQPTSLHEEFGALCNQHKVLGSLDVFMVCGLA